MSDGRDHVQELVSFHLADLGETPADGIAPGATLAGLSLPPELVAQPGELDFTDIEEGGAEDPVRMYLREIGRVALLTADQEKVYARQIEDAKRLRQIEAHLPAALSEPAT